MAKKLWGGRFSKATDPFVEEFTRSVRYDYKLAPYDIIGSIAHVAVLKKAHLLTAPEASKITGGLLGLLDSVEDGVFPFDADTEDIHTDIQNKLEAKIGDVALKLHTARSRNDQVAFATKLYCLNAAEEIKDALADATETITHVAAKYKEIIMPGFTHLQHAQPVYLKDHLGVYVKMLTRDFIRLETAAEHITLSMGAGALAGTPIEAKHYRVVSTELPSGVSDHSVPFQIEATANPLDAVSDRDFAIEFLSSLAVVGMHLSRISEDLVLWSGKEYGFVELDDAFCTGSSLMPQKKNPDALEMIRGYAGRLYGNLMSVLTVMKALPLTYNRDMQLDKEPLFNSFETILIELKIVAGIFKTIVFNTKRIEEGLADESLYATDLVYYLVGKGIAFKEAHAIVGKLVKYSVEKGVLITHMPEAELKKISDKFIKREIAKLYDPVVSVRSKKSVRRR